MLILSAHRPGRSPSQRFRYEQYLTYLESEGYDFDYSFLISKTDDSFFYKKGHFLKKFFFLCRSILRRYNDLKSIQGYDIVFIQREAFLLGTVYFERKISESGVPIIFDFDDAIWEVNSAGGNKALSFLKNPDKTSRILSLSSVVIAGNEYLAEYALQFNSNVTVIPTTIDTSYHFPKVINPKVVIGWTGTFSTFPYLEALIPLLSRIKNKYTDVEFKIIVDFDLEIPELGTRTTIWNKFQEIDQLREISIGIMPLPDNIWTRGKCGFKGLQYMSLSIPTLMSPVGVNTEIIKDSENGFLPESDDQWFNRLSELIESSAMRTKIGKKGYESLVKHYSVQVNKKHYLKLFEEVTSHVDHDNERTEKKR